MSKIICLLSGLIDQPLNDLGGKTPLEKANTPCLDAMTRQNYLPPQNGGLETSLAALLLGKSEMPTLGKAPFEALAKGFSLRSDQVAFCMRFVSTGEDVVVDVSDTLISDSEGLEFCSRINSHFGSEGLHAIHIRGPQAVLISDQAELRDAIAATLTLNPVDCIGLPWMSQLPACKDLFVQIGEVLQSNEINELRLDLEEDPVNGVLLSSGAVPFRERLNREDIKLATSVPVSFGLARSIGCRVKRIPQDIRRFDQAQHILSGCEDWLREAATLLIEVPYLWESTYKGDLLEKIKTLEWLDKNLLSPLKKQHPDFSCLSLRAVDIRSGDVSSGETALFSSKQPAETAWGSLLAADSSEHQPPSHAID